MPMQGNNYLAPRQEITQFAAHGWIIKRRRNMQAKIPIRLPENKCRNVHTIGDLLGNLTGSGLYPRMERQHSDRAAWNVFDSRTRKAG
jgi:hypothetical protein